MPSRFDALRAQAISPAVTYRFVFEHEGWLHATLNDTTGELLITSDWGNYGYRWDALGDRTVTEFLAEKGREQWDCHYIVQKFLNGTQSKNLEEVVDTDATWKPIATRIIEGRRAQNMDADRARELWDELETWKDADFDMEALPDELCEFLGGWHDAFHQVVMGRSGWWQVLADELLPWFCRWLDENVVNKRAEANHVPT